MSEKPLFRDVTADDDVPEITEIESLCINCESQGLTRLFLTRIPFFKDVVVASFACDDCGYKNSELQPAARIQDFGITFTFKVKTQNDLNRQVIQTNYSSVKIPELEFEIPPSKGYLTTIEGIIDKAVAGLLQDQPVRKIMHPTDAEQIEKFTERLNKLKTCDEPFTLIVDDPSGNSFVENVHAPSMDPEMKVKRYDRSQTQDEAVGIIAGEDDNEQENNTEDVGRNEVLTMESNCPNCNAPCSINMKRVDVPNFKEVVIMACNCDKCGYRDNEVKSGSGIEDQGIKITLKITNINDMKRDLLKSDTCSIAIPELELETGMGTLGGKFTTVEGILENLRDQLSTSNPFIIGDSSDEDSAKNMKIFCSKITDIMEGRLSNIHLILDDPAGNSYLQNPFAPEKDSKMTIERYERDYEQNDDLGLNDMKTENY